MTKLEKIKTVRICNRNLCATMTNATTKLRFCATPKSYILCNTEIYHFCNQKFQHFLQQKSFVAKNVKISDCKNGGLPCCTSVLHKMSDFGVAQNLNFVVALVIAAHKFLLCFSKDLLLTLNPYFVLFFGVMM